MKVDMEELIKNETNKYAKRFYEELHKDGYRVAEKERYTHSKTHVTVLCQKEHKYSVIPSNFNSGHRCPHCQGVRKTTKQFTKEVYSLVGGGYRILGEYKNSLTRIKIEHSRCGYIWDVLPNNFLNGNRCSKCADSKRSNKQKKSLEGFKKEVYGQVFDEYEVLGEYVNSRTRIKIRHNQCSHEYNVLPNNFLRGNRCPNCNNREKSVSTYKFKEKNYKKLKDHYIILGEYTNSNTPIKIEYAACGHRSKVLPASLLRGIGCSRCFGNSRKTTEQFAKEVYSLVADEYQVLGEYINAHTPIKMCHSKCSFEYTMAPRNFISSNSRCPQCFGENGSKTTKQFAQEVYDLVGGEYSVLGEYENNSTHIKIRHNNCEHVWEVTPNQFLRGSRCPKHNSSKGEVTIGDYLTENGVSFIQEETLEGLQNKRFLRCDFHLPEYNLVIEFDGSGHFVPFAFSKNRKEMIDKLESQQLHDRIKNQYCIDNNIRLIRIPYWEFDNIEYILNNTLKHFNVIEGKCEDTSIIEKYYVKDGWCHNTYLSWNDKKVREKELTLQ